MQALKPLSWKKLACVFESLGFRFERQKGSHRSYVKPGLARPLVIPKESEVPVFIITGLMKTAGIDRATFFELLKEC
ncbi:MAG TPA: type II toxin-antitoxin system HicA family toxin [Acidobacteriota bacterium]|nr:type II toxin-antitoxin system HicA family toxin [Acidobacteriota bacterium]